MSDTDNVAADQLQQYIERIETLNGEKKDISDSIKDVFTEAAAVGFDKKAMREIIKLRKKDKDTRDHEDAMIETYRAALGLD